MPVNEITLPDALRDAIRAAANRAEVRQVVEEVYRDLAAEVDKRRPVCVISGRCCRFEEYGHRLYVTTMELAAFVHGFDSFPKSIALTQSMEKWDGSGCPFQVGKLCGVHALRPFGCRVFFCDETSTRWQQEAYEAFHSRLKRLHQELGVPYFYVEWRQALGVLLPARLPAAPHSTP